MKYFQWYKAFALMLSSCVSLSTCMCVHRHMVLHQTKKAILDENEIIGSTK